MENSDDDISDTQQEIALLAQCDSPYIMILLLMDSNYGLVGD